MIRRIKISRRKRGGGRGGNQTQLQEGQKKDVGSYRDQTSCGLWDDYGADPPVSHVQAHEGQESDGSLSRAN